MSKKLLFGLLLFLSLYGIGRLYYRVTDGFSINNIISDLSYDARWETRPLTPPQRQLVNSILDQKFSYLGKGCQSYVFLSADGSYVLKFFKYQRFRTQPWIDFFAFIPAVNSYRDDKIEKKKNKREGFFASWVLAFNELSEESGLIYVHLNKTDYLKKKLTFTDKMGYEHTVDLDKMEFLIQRKATMLCPYIKALMAENKTEEAKTLLSSIIALVLSENARGLADNDHALMQNTGVYHHKPIHIDVGQFMRHPEIKRPEIYSQELFSKMFKFRRWLRKEYPELADHLESQLVSIIGPEFYTMKPHFKMHD